MKKVLLTTLMILLVCVSNAQENNRLLFFQTNWGNDLSWDAFCEKTKKSGYDGIEIWFPNSEESRQQLKAALDKYQLKVAFLNGTNRSLPFQEGLQAFENHFKTLVSWKPAYINCHTGSDFFTFDQNKTLIQVANKISKTYNIPIYHETHRGRFSYNLPDTHNYVEEIPDLRLTLDISHWMVVHESLLEGKDTLLTAVLSNSNHIHARVGHAEGPQVNDPQAPEWKKALDRHMDLWEDVIDNAWKNGRSEFTITTEFGPPDYLPTLPYTRVPVSDQWKANVFIMNAIKERMSPNNTQH